MLVAYMRRDPRPHFLPESMMHEWTARVVLALFAFTAWAAVAVAQESRAQVRGAEFSAAVNIVATNVKAEGTIFVPDSASRVASALVLVNVYHGLEVFADEEWRKLADACACAILDVHLGAIRALSGNTPVEAQPMRHAEMGGADALLLLIQRLGAESGHQELKEAPMVLWGWSVGAAFGSSFAQLHPERVAAFIRYHIHRRGVPVDLGILAAFLRCSWPVGRIRPQESRMRKNYGRPVEQQAHHGPLRLKPTLRTVLRRKCCCSLAMT